MLTVAASAFGVGACSDVLGSDDEVSTLSFRASSASASALVSDLAAAAIPVTGGGHTVDVQQVDAVFDRIKLESVRGSDRDDHDSDSDVNYQDGQDSDSENDVDSDSDNDRDFRAGATTVTLPLDGTAITPISAEIPPGRYDELQLDARYLRIRGTYDALPFDVTVPVNLKIESELEPPFEPTSAGPSPNITVNVDVASWFRNADGSVIDPRQLSTDATLRAQFRNRVRASFRSFRDTNKDGRDSDSR
jgi:hypothetical protein